MEQIMPILSMIGTLVLMLAVFVGTYYASRLIGRRGAGTKGNHIEIVDRVMLGKDQSLLLVRVADRVFMLGCTPHHIEKLEELESDLFPETTEMVPQQSEFEKIWMTLRNAGKGGKRE